MRRYIVLFLITGTVWAQTDFDKLVYKDGREILGEFSEITRTKVYFKAKGRFAVYRVPINRIQTLELKDGTIIINDETTMGINSNENIELTTEEKAVYNAKIEAFKWGFYPPLVGTTFLGLMLGLDARIGEIWDSPLTFPICLGAPYLLLKLNKNNIKSVSSEELEQYEEIYFKEYRKRLFKNVIVSSICTAATGTLLALSQVRLDDDFYFGP